jgi:hypothetical protein
MHHLARDVIILILVVTPIYWLIQVIAWMIHAV